MLCVDLNEVFATAVLHNTSCSFSLCHRSDLFSHIFSWQLVYVNKSWKIPEICVISQSLKYFLGLTQMMTALLVYWVLLNVWQQWWTNDLKGWAILRTHRSKEPLTSPKRMNPQIIFYDVKVVLRILSVLSKNIRFSAALSKTERMREVHAVSHIVRKSQIFSPKKRGIA